MQANPCGLIAKYHFTDVFYEIRELTGDGNGKVFEIDDDKIAAEHEWIKFKVNEDVAVRNGYWTSPVDPHLINWY